MSLARERRAGAASAPWGRPKPLSLVVVMMLCAWCACDAKPPAPKTPPAPPEPEALPEPARRDVFGVPLPPRVRSMARNEHYVWVETDMNIPQLEAFYREALAAKEFEVLRVNSTLRIVGLRPFMPVVKAAHVRGKRTNVRMIFMPSRSSEGLNARRGQADPGEPAATTQARRQRQQEQEQERASQAPGQDVLIKTSSGELLAPGAKWGEPYWPPEGSALHTRAMKHNWGKPFGQWHTH